MSRARDVSRINASLSASVSNITGNYEQNITYSSSAPSNPVSGQLWVDTTSATTHLLKAYNGSTWINVGSAEGGFNYFFGAGV